MSFVSCAPRQSKPMQLLGIDADEDRKAATGLGRDDGKKKKIWQALSLGGNRRKQDGNGLSEEPRASCGYKGGNCGCGRGPFRVKGQGVADL